MTVSEALAFFAAHDAVQAALKPLADVGLEYLRLGQPVPTLSGGEAQRLKLAGHLVEARVAAKSESAQVDNATVHHARLAASCFCSTNRPPACISTTSPNCCAPSAS